MTAGSAHAGRDAGLADWLGLAAAPTFAAMALATVVWGGPMESLCSAAGGVPVGGMVPMYLLMCAFHVPPWLRLAAARRRAALGR
jgi:hypothetical protein